MMKTSKFIQFNIKSLVQVSGLHSYARVASFTSYIVVIGFKCIYLPDEHIKVQKLNNLGFEMLA